LTVAPTKNQTEMKNTIYKTAKMNLKEVAIDAKKRFKTDKPMIRQIINDTADSICKNMQLSEYQRDLLSNYACTLHPKK